MSNVLIGIIGVILFIGLALAGALILGDDFRSASRDTKVTRLVAQMQQISQGLEMYQLKTGAPFPSYVGINDDARLIPRFLKSGYVEPEGGGGPVIYLMGGTRYLVLGALTDAMCKGIQLQITGSESYPAVDGTTTLNGAVGCANHNTNRLIYVRL
jgi:hypothetical protein